MPSLFDNYCYDTVQGAAKAMMNKYHIATTATMISPKSYTVAGSTATIVFDLYAIPTGNPSLMTINKTFMSCTDVGYDQTNNVLNPTDTATLIGFIILLLVTGYVWRILRRPI